MKAHCYKRASGARASLRFINISREWACVLHVCKARAKCALRQIGQDALGVIGAGYRAVRICAHERKERL